MTSLIDRLSYDDVAKTIDHSLLRPELDDAFITDGCKLAARYQEASVCCRPADVARAIELLAGTGVAVGTVIGFPHGGSTTEAKVFEAEQALRAGARRPARRHGARGHADRGDPDRGDPGRVQESKGARRRGPPLSGRLAEPAFPGRNQQVGDRAPEIRCQSTPTLN